MFYFVLLFIMHICSLYWFCRHISGFRLCRRCLNKSVKWFSCASLLWRYWLGGRKGIRPVKTEWWGAGVIICLERGADLHMAQLMSLSLTVSCFSKIQIGFSFLVPAYLSSPGKWPINGCVCVCVCVCVCYEESGAQTQPCPFQGAYHFIYTNNSGGECRNPASYVTSCASASHLLWRFKHCADAAYTYDRGALTLLLLFFKAHQHKAAGTKLG